MKKEYISYLSGTIFLIYGLANHKLIFTILAIALIIIGYADHLKTKK
ncbi:hypothetical protein ACVRZD_01780 [Streptococcus hongkongensis]|nr:membrane protein [Streptococcus uberis]